MTKRQQSEAAVINIIGKTIASVRRTVHEMVMTFTDGSTYSVASHDEENVVGLCHEFIPALKNNTSGNPPNREQYIRRTMMEKTKFVLDDSSEFEGYDTGRRWNGWACPSFTATQADSLVLYWNRQPGCKAWFDTDHNGYVFDNNDWPEPDMFLPTRQPDGSFQWEIGAGCWCWNRADDFKIGG